MSVEDYGAWERHAVSRFADQRLSPEQVLDTLARDVEVLRQWRPQPRGQSLADAIAGLPAPIARAVAPMHDWYGFEEPVKRYLAAHAFANWSAYQARGLRSWLRSVVAALETLSRECDASCAAAARSLDRELLLEALRAADLWLRHQASRDDLIREWSAAEDRPDLLSRSPNRPQA
jgi:hypothetical protein